MYSGETEIFLDKLTAARLAKTVKESRVWYWKRFKLPHMVKQNSCNKKERKTT